MNMGIDMANGQDKTVFTVNGAEVEWENIGNNDLRLSAVPIGGFRHVVLRDADDGDVIVVNEDDVRALRDRLSQELKELA